MERGKERPIERSYGVISGFDHGCQRLSQAIEAIDQPVRQSNLTALRPGYSLESCPNPFECERGTEQPGLIDGFNRKIDYLRMSVTDRCDFRCVYCMAEDMQFLPRQQILSLEELFQVAERFVALGTRKIRLTGGEPLVRQGIVDLCGRIAALPGLRELCLTSNGSQLGAWLSRCSTPG